MLDIRINQARLSLKTILGVVPVAAGLDKFTNLLTHWSQYLSPTFKGLLPMSDGAFMHVVGIIEIVVGLMVLTKWTRIGAYVAAVWLVCIAVNLLITGRYFDIAARDIALSVAAFALARLEEAHAQSEAPSHNVRVNTHASPAHG